MTTNKTLPTTIHAKVHENAAQKVTRFFNATFDDIISELYQNARRAGATLIEVVITPDDVTVDDNGHGVADPQALLSFGHSEWANADGEDPAGMGVYSLAQRSTTITSRHRDAGQGWTCRLEPAHFNGERPRDRSTRPDADGPRNPESSSKRRPETGTAKTRPRWQPYTSRWSSR